MTTYTDCIINQKIKEANDQYSHKISERLLVFEKDKEKVRQELGDDVIDAITKEIKIILCNGEFEKLNNKIYAFKKHVKLPYVLIDPEVIQSDWPIAKLIAGLIRIPGISMQLDLHHYEQAIVSMSCWDTFMMTLCMPLCIFKCCCDLHYKKYESDVMVEISGQFSVCNRFVSEKQELSLLLQKSNSA